MKGFTTDKFTGKLFREFKCGSLYNGYHCFIIYDKQKRTVQVLIGVVSGKNYPEFYPVNIIFEHDFLKDRFDIVLRAIKEQAIYAHHYLVNQYLQSRG